MNKSHSQTHNGFAVNERATRFADGVTMARAVEYRLANGYTEVAGGGTP